MKLTKPTLNRIDNMKDAMATITKWMHGKSKFFHVTNMMIYLCLLAAKFADFCFHRSHPSCFNRILDSMLGFNFLFVVLAIFRRPTSPCWAFLVFSAFFAISYFAFFGASVLSTAQPLALFTTPLKAIFSRFIFIKLAERLNVIALRALFCYNLLRHGFFLIKKLRLEPLQTQYLCGLFYYTTFLPEGK